MLEKEIEMYVFINININININIHPVAAEVVQCGQKDGRKERQTDMTKLIAVFAILRTCLKFKRFAHAVCLCFLHAA